MTNVRIALPAAAAVDEVIEIKTLITHPMETGFRRDAMGRAIPRNILTRFECRSGDTLLFAAQLHTGIAANPFLSFHVRVPASGELQFLWQGDKGFEHIETRQVTVG